MDNELRLEIEPAWDEIEGLAQASAGFLRSHEVPPDVVESFTMVITELVENGVKYGAFAGPASRLAVVVQVNDRHLTTEVTNPFEASALPNLERMDKMIQWIRGFQDPFEAYVERLKEIAGRSLSDEESGLGLVRIAYEGNAILDFFVTDGHRLNVSAVAAYN